MELNIENLVCTSSTLEFEFKFNKTVRYSIIDSKGYLLVSGDLLANNEKYQLNVSQLVSGSYWLKILDKDISAEHRFVKP
jgi:hypothetical protein